jgi:hypothetical protein
MNFRSRQLLTIGATVCLALIGLNDAHAQKRRRALEKRSVLVNSASHVSAEMTRGKLRPSETKRGDEVALRLTDDVKANGDVVLKKGTTITGIVRNVKSAEMKGQQQSIMEIEWFAPPLQGMVARQLSIALQAVTEVSRLTEEPSSKNVEQFRFKPTDGARNTPGATRYRASERSIGEHAVCRCGGCKNRIQSGIELWHFCNTVVQGRPQRMDHGRRIETVRGTIFTFEQRHVDHVSQ